MEDPQGIVRLRGPLKDYSYRLVEEVEKEREAKRGTMNISSDLNRLSPVQGKYRPINYEYIWGSSGIHGGSPPGLQHRTTGLPNYTARAAAALVKRGNPSSVYTVLLI